MLPWRRFFSRTSNVLGVALVMFFAMIAILAPRLAPSIDPDNPSPFKNVTQSFSREPLPPGPDIPLGTTPQIRISPLFGIAPGQDAAYQWDVYHTLVWGTRSALRFGLMVTVATAAIGIFLGLISGYVGGWFSMIIMRITDAFLAFPVIAGLWVIQRTLFGNIFNAFIDPGTFSWWERIIAELKIDPIMLAFILFLWMPYARLMNAQVRRAMTSDYVLAARSMGARGSRIIWRHLLPNTIAPAVVLAARDVGGVVVLACAFIFIGFGGNVAWGVMLVTSRDYVIGLSGNPFAYWWTFVPVSLALVFFGIGWNLVGDGLNALLNPYER